MRIRRCAVLLIEPREELEFRLQSLAEGGTGLDSRTRWLALAPHLDAELELDEAQVLALGRMSRTRWSDDKDLARRHGAKLVRGLIDKGLLISEAPRYRAQRLRDAALRRAHWYAPAAVLHLLGRWRAVKTGEDAERAGLKNMLDLIQALGPPPPAIIARRKPEQRVALPRARPNAIDVLLRRRVTCRNFDTGRSVRHAAFARLLQRVFAAQASFEIRPDTVVLKKNTPSGGGLHPIEAYALVQRVDGVAPGLYHYHALDHALEPLRARTPAQLRKIASRAVAGQEYFADAAVVLFLTARFERTFWKYRNHSKSYRAVVLEAGHLSQMIYLTATELGLGAFVSAAINERDIEQALGLDGLRESALAVCGFGPRARKKATVEFDPLNEVWK